MCPLTTNRALLRFSLAAKRLPVPQARAIQTPAYTVMKAALRKNCQLHISRHWVICGEMDGIVCCQVGGKAQDNGRIFIDTRKSRGEIKLIDPTLVEWAINGSRKPQEVLFRIFHYGDLLRQGVVLSGLLATGQFLRPQTNVSRHQASHMSMQV
jgi:hypothetical protein